MMDDSLQWSVSDDSFESVPDPEEEVKIDHKDPSSSRVGDGHGHGSEMRKNEEEDSSADFSDAGVSAVFVGDHLFLCAVSESGQRDGGTEHEPIDAVTLSAGGPTAPQQQTETDRSGLFHDNF